MSYLIKSKNHLTKFTKAISLILALFIIQAFVPSPEEGAYPLTELSKLDLKKAGLKISKKEIFNNSGNSLTHALVRLGGCTGSFISDEGMIITNHHCVFGTVARLSTAKQNYLKNGFVANSKEDELHTGLPCKITVSFEDVSEKVLKGASKDPLKAVKTINENIAAIIKNEKAKNMDLTYQVSEMFTGRKFTLFRYQTFLDVRLVYVPPRQIGEFGGSKDNWEWPRHNGDFSVVRAYMGKDGKPAKYSKDNIPYKPGRFLKVNANGTDENDFVFILGYPGRTYKHKSAAFVKSQNDHLLPFIADWFNWQIKTLEDLTKDNTAQYLKVVKNIQGLANTAKNFEGKMQGIRRTGLIALKQAEEKQMIANVKDEGESKYYNENLSKINDAYKQMDKVATRNLLVSRFGRVGPLAAAQVLNTARTEMMKLPKKERKEFAKKNNEKIIARINRSFGINYPKFNTLAIAELIERIQNLKGKKVEAVQNIGNTSAWIKGLKNSFFIEKLEITKELKEHPYKCLLKTKKDMCSKFMADLKPEMVKIRASYVELNNQEKALMPAYLDMKMNYGKSPFVPDANSTLRLTYGYVKGYKPNDAVYERPFTTIKGILEKVATDHVDYRMEKKWVEKLKLDNISDKLKDKKTGKVVVGLLYNLDTTGGNSGSPILDAYGNIIGVNFDRAYTATINDYAWNESYSRSIGVDIRYVLYVIKYVSGANHVIKEMGVEL